MPAKSFHFSDSEDHLKTHHIDEATEHQVLIEDTDYLHHTVAPEGLKGLDINDPPRPPHDTFLSKIVPTGGVVATVFSTAATAAGGGILGLPSAFLQSGALMGCVWVLLIAMTTAYSLRLLAIASELTGERSYERLAYVLLGRGGTYLVSAMRFLNCFGSMIAYVISIGDLISPIFKGAGAPSWTQEGNGYRCLVALFWLVCYFPLMLPRRVNALRYVSTAGILCIIFFCLCVFVHFCMHSVAPDIKVATSGNTALSGIGVFLFSFICQVNQVELYREMRPSTVARFTLSSIIASALLMLMYGMVGLFGYLEFGEAISGGTILAMYKPVQEPQFFIAFIGVFVKLMASYGLFGYVCLSAVYHTINVDGDKVPFWKHFLLAAFLALITLILGLFWPGVETVFNLVGGICGGSLGFILPVLFYMYAGNWTLQTVGIGNYVASYLVLWAGVFAVVCGTAVTIYNLAI